MTHCLINRYRHVVSTVFVKFKNRIAKSIKVSMAKNASIPFAMIIIHGRKKVAIKTKARLPQQKKNRFVKKRSLIKWRGFNF